MSQNGQIKRQLDIASLQTDLSSNLLQVIDQAVGIQRRLLEAADVADRIRKRIGSGEAVTHADIGRMAHAIDEFYLVEDSAPLAAGILDMAFSQLCELHRLEHESFAENRSRACEAQPPAA